MMTWMSWLPGYPSDPRIRFVARQQPGIVGALNTGLAQARGQHIARMDDDDIAYPTRLATQLAYLNGNSGTQLCGAACASSTRKDKANP